MIQINREYRGEEDADREPLFEIGQTVRHRRYGYRGVVVSLDRKCRADPVWYMANKTQPDRNQPWYHVLVDRSETVTYAAETSLTADQSGLPVRHPLVTQFFSDFENGRYIRNAEPWLD